MTPAQVEVARQLVALPDWRWRVPMASEDGDRVWDQRDTHPDRGWRRDGSVLPDLTDPATAGVLLERLAAMAYRTDRVPVGVSFAPGGLNPIQVRVYRGKDDPVYYHGSCLGEAVARALVALGSGA